eukprot:761689-Hanusia_phi.AAC.3
MLESLAENLRWLVPASESWAHGPLLLAMFKMHRDRNQNGDQGREVHRQGCGRCVCPGDQEEEAARASPQQFEGFKCAMCGSSLSLNHALQM